MNSCELELDVVNIVASGDLGREFDLDPLATAIDTYEARYEPESFPGLLIRFKEDGPVIIIFASGSYTLMGVTTAEEMKELFCNLIHELSDLGIDIRSEDSEPVVQNLICKGYLNREVDLDTLTVVLGLDNVEYEPEQSPFLYYWLPDDDCLITIPSNGEVIITGVQDVETAEEAFSQLRELIEPHF